MRLYKVSTFIISTGLAFVVFGAIALGIQTTGLVSRPPIAASTPLSQIDAEEQAWLALGIDDYQITVHFSGAWDAHTVTLTIQDGTSVECSIEYQYVMTNDPISSRDCENIDVERYFVQGLFSEVRNLPMYAQNMQAEVTPEVDYDATYHFPTRIVFVPINVMDAGFVYEVLAFEPLP